ncbi:MAG: DUF1385 domain-containing protein [Abditibacteriota bacterium]|nr:DUF1385 domain-containing protein [Abditibacteriota bacterium]
MSEDANKKPAYGGQAVIEGVMMRGRSHFAIACRRANGEIRTTLEPVQNYLGGIGSYRTPFVRGVIALIDSMYLGMKSLFWSSDIAMTDQMEEEARQREEELAGSGDRELSPKEAKRRERLLREQQKAKSQLDSAQGKANGILIGASAFVGMAVAVALFMLVPIYLSGFVTNTLLRIPSANKWAFSLVEGFFKLLIFFLYVYSISFMPDVRRIFSYHGAEHKTINAFEAGEELTPDRVRGYSRIHTRCGTSFILIVIAVTIIVFCFVPNENKLLRFALKLLALPLVAGISYEIIKLSARFPCSVFTRVFLSPGLLMQRITTREPEDAMLECAIASLKLVVDKDREEAEGAGGEAAADGGGPEDAPAEAGSGGADT